jgi:hypothetical protein
VRHCAPGGIRTPNLLIRRSRPSVWTGPAGWPSRPEPQPVLRAGPWSYDLGRVVWLPEWLPVRDLVLRSGATHYESQAGRLIKSHHACASSTPFAVVHQRPGRWLPTWLPGLSCVRRRGGGSARALRSRFSWSSTWAKWLPLGQWWYRPSGSWWAIASRWAGSMVSCSAPMTRVGTWIQPVLPRGRQPN